MLTTTRKRDEKASRKEVMDYVYNNEKRIHSRTNILQSKKRSFLKVLQLGYEMVSLKENAEKIKKRIEENPKAKDVILDVSFFNTKMNLSLIDGITRPFAN